MPIDISQNIDRFEADDLNQFTFANTFSVPSTLQFIVYNTDGTTLAPVAVQSGLSVTVSGATNVGLFFVNRQLPSSVGFYSGEWRAHGSGTAQQSLFTVTRFTFEISKTEPRSFLSYGNKNNVLKVARQLVGRGDLTERDVEPHMVAAYGYINGRLGIMTTVPLSPTPNYIAQGEEVLSVYTLYGQFGGSEKNEIPPSYNKLRDDFLEYISAVTAGSATIYVDSGGATRLEQTITAITGGIEGGLPTFGRRPFEEQRVDPDIIDSEADE